MNVLKFFVIAAIGLLTACATETTTVNGVTTTVEKPLVTLAQAQAAAPVALAIVRDLVQTYEIAAMVDPGVSSDINTALAELSDAVDVFVAVGPSVDYLSAAKAILASSDTILARIPNLDPEVKLRAQIAVQTISLVIPLLAQLGA